MRARFLKGALVASTNKLKAIQSKRLNIEVRYNPINNKILSSQVVGIRTDLQKF